MVYYLAVRDPKTRKLRVLCPVEDEEIATIIKRHLEKFTKPKTNPKET